MLYQKGKTKTSNGISCNYMKQRHKDRETICWEAEIYENTNFPRATNNDMCIHHKNYDM